MRHLLYLTVLAILTINPPGRADPPTKKTPAVETPSQLVEQLSSKDPQARDRAAKALAALGKEALPALQKAKVSADPELRRRLDELIPPLERSILLSARRVTLHVTDKPIRDVLAELAKQTGYKIQYGWEGQQVVRDKVVYTFHFDQLPFWEAMDKISEAAGLVLNQGGWMDDSMHFNNQDAFVPFSCYSGPFKIIAQSFNYSRSNNFGHLPKNPAQVAQPVQEFLNMSLQIATEPRLPILAVGQVRLTAAVDEEGHSMLNGNEAAPDPNSRYYGGWGRGYMHQTQANLRWPSKTARSVKLLRGIIPVTLLADQKPTVVTDKILACKGKKLKALDATFQIDDISNQNKQYTIKMTVIEESRENPNDYNRINSLQQRIELQDDKGNRLPYFVNITNWGGPNNAQFTLMAQPNNNPKLGAPARLIYYAWVLLQHEIRFELKDLPLP